MKKALAILMIFALVASVAVAEVSVGAWGRGFFVPVANGGGKGENGTGLATSWGTAPRIGFTVAGNSDNVGFQVDINADGAFGTNEKTDSNGDKVDVGNYLTFGDQQKIWVKPIDMMTVQIGKIFDDTLRGNGCFGSFDWIRLSWTGEDFTFTRVIAQAGAEIAVQPMDALYAYVAFDALPNFTQNAFSDMQVGAGYTIEGIGQIRAQYLGAIATYDTKGLADKTYGTIEVAFKVAAVENLYADIGFKMSTDDKYGMKKEKDINLYANYKVSGATLHVLAGLALNKVYKGDEKMGIELGFGADYGLEGGIGLGADVRYKNDVAAGSKDGMVGFFAGATKGFSNGLIGVGVEVSTTTFAPGIIPDDDAKEMSWAIPVRLEYWF